MIKSLLNADQEPPEGTEVIIEDSALNPNDAVITEAKEIPQTSSVSEVSEEAKFFIKPEVLNEENIVKPEEFSPEELYFETPEREFLQMDSPVPQIENPPFAEQSADERTAAEAENNLFQTDSKSLTTAETIRQSGMAYSAAIVFFGAVVFMMILGWFADLLLGSKPWGIVVGIVLGGVIGFIQFFRITSQIFKNN